MKLTYFCKDHGLQFSLEDTVTHFVEDVINRRPGTIQSVSGDNIISDVFIDYFFDKIDDSLQLNCAFSERVPIETREFWEKVLSEVEK